MPAADPTTPDYAGLLDSMIRVGAELVRRLADDPPRPGQDIAADYERLTRAVRRSILLVQRLPTLAAEPARHRAAARRQVIRAVEDAIQHRARGGAAEHLEAEFRERLDDPDLDEEIDTRPIPAIIADICRDLRVAPGHWQFKRRTPAEIHDLADRAATPPGTPSRPPAARPQRDPECEDDDLPPDPAGTVATILRYEALARNQR